MTTTPAAGPSTSDRRGGTRVDPLVTRYAMVGALVTTGVTAVWINAGNLVGSFESLGLLDVQVYRMGGRSIVEGTSLYDARYAHDALPFTYSPVAALLFVPLHLLGWTGAAVAITAAGLAALVRTCWLLAAAALPADRTTQVRLLAAAAVVLGLAMWPTRSTLEYGQINLVLMWLVVEDVLGAGRSSRRGGVLTGLAAAVKLTPAFVVAFFLAAGERRRAVNAVVAAAVATLVGVAVRPAESWDYWTRWIFDPARVGDPAYLANQSANGAVTRILGGPPGPVVTVLLAMAIGGAVLAVAGTLWRRGRPVHALAAASLGPLLVSPISWTHHWVWLVALAVALAAPPGGPETRPMRAVRLALLGILVAVALVRPMSVLPAGGGAEAAYDLGQRLVAGAYVWLGLALLAFLAVTARQVGAADRGDPARDVAGDGHHPVVT